ncbi:DsbA family protein [Marinobacterium rhizophilum]|uniref:DsbA family protein n=1 Tax=Marinobacterium rhizophilum TaxID=420402 RepID=UPI000382056F|nr:DsbA family protein [Marinobacterium rhizophilum]
MYRISFNSMSGLSSKARCVLVALTLFSSIPAGADEDSESFRSELRALSEGQQRMQQELLEIKALLEVMPQHQQPPQESTTAKAPPKEPPLPMQMTINGSPFLGREDAPVVLIEFTDYQCPFCRRHFSTNFPLLVKDYVETGKIKIVLKEFPLQKLHPQAVRMAMAAQCAGDQNRYWQMHDKLFNNPSRKNMADMEAFAADLELDGAKFMSCMTQGDYGYQIKADFDLGVSAGVRGTPFFFIGPLNQAEPDRVMVEQYLYGAQPYSEFRRVIEAMLKKEVNKAMN